MPAARARSYWTIPEVAKMMGVSTGTVIKRFKRLKIARHSKITPQLLYAITEGEFGYVEQASVYERLDRPAMPLECLDSTEGLAMLRDESRLRQRRLALMVDEHKARIAADQRRDRRERKMDRKAYAAQYARDNDLDNLDVDDTEPDDVPAMVEAMMIANERVAQRRALHEYEDAGISA